MTELNGSELWEIFYGVMKGAVPEEVTDAVLTKVAAAINEVFVHPMTNGLSEGGLSEARDLIEGLRKDENFLGLHWQGPTAKMIGERCAAAANMLDARSRRSLPGSDAGEPVRLADLDALNAAIAFKFSNLHVSPSSPVDEAPDPVAWCHPEALALLRAGKMATVYGSKAETLHPEIPLYASPDEAQGMVTPDLALIEATARKINPGRSEDHIKSVAMDALSIFRALTGHKP